MLNTPAPSFAYGQPHASHAHELPKAVFDMTWHDHATYHSHEDDVDTASSATSEDGDVDSRTQELNAYLAGVPADQHGELLFQE
eukprot:4024317-Karenia_brevis.AAC.1